MARRAALPAVLACLVLAAPARAHLVSTDLGPFYDGALHAVVTPLEVASVLAVGVMAGLGGPADARAALRGFVWGWALGALAAYRGAAPPDTLGVFGMLALIVLGVGAAAGTRMGPVPAGAAAALVGLARGALAGDEAAQSAQSWTALAGFGSAVCILVTLVLGAAVWLGAGPARIGLRVGASWLAALALLLLGWQARGVGLA